MYRNFDVIYYFVKGAVKFSCWKLIMEDIKTLPGSFANRLKRFYKICHLHKASEPRPSKKSKVYKYNYCCKLYQVKMHSHIYLPHILTQATKKRS